ncbi:hypothetical protein LSM04_004225 [Trypanosoma melophagium]|uniref:uncharacterized protein n=1 Tax=Trypanosoma melophagium TaxID=715481 RepID=UPI00351A6F0B|nr:hypothetical protein LSM04_004225 [Trypanosoma melophagium]
MCDNITNTNTTTAGGGNGGSPPLTPLIATAAAGVARVEAGLTRDVEADRQRREFTYAGVAPLRDFMYAGEEVRLPRRIAELRAKRAKLVNTTIMPTTEEGVQGP